MLRFSSDEGFFSSYGGLFATFSLRGGPFCYIFLLVWGIFLKVGAFLLFFSPFGGTFLSSWGILWLYVFFYGLAPSPYGFFCGHMLLCNFHPMTMKFDNEI